MMLINFRKLPATCSAMMSAMARLSLIAGIVFAGSNSEALAQDAGPRTFYVSRQAAQGSQDGSSWRNAWPELNRINWSKVRPGDTIKIAGGTYSTSLQIGSDGEQGRPIKILAATDSGYNGQVRIEGFKQYRTGIQVGKHHDIVIQGTRWNSISVSRFLNSGISTGYNSARVTLKNIAVSYSGSGIQLQGGDHSLDQLIVTSNRINVDMYINGQFGSRINRCYIANPVSDRITDYKADGIRINDTSNTTHQHLSIRNCVLGPGLATAVRYGMRNSSLAVENNLFINAGTANIVKLHRTLPNSYYSIIFFANNTSFLTPLNASNRGHSALDFVQGQDSVLNNIVYGGTVSVTIPPRVSSRSGGNVQFRTSGNTTFLAPTQVDPKFTSSVANLTGATSLSTLGRLNFSLSSSAPAAAVGKGSTITSRAKLFSTNQ